MRSGVKILLVYPAFPMTYWGFQLSLRLIGKRATLPPLGLVTLAAVLLSSWTLRLVDLNVEELTDGDIRWADAVLTGGMLVQSDSLHEVVRRAKAHGRPVVAGGPGPSTSPDAFAEADVVFCGEIEGRTAELVAALEDPESGSRKLEPQPGTYPELTNVRVPRYDLLDRSQYCSLSLQYSRGCPFKCEFCDIIELYGRRPRVKSTSQVLAELDELHRLGYRGSLFIVDDNFIGNRTAVRELLPALTQWQREHDRPFDFYTEASVNLASDLRLVRAMVEAGFTSVFLGIETPSRTALAAAGKSQNLKLDLSEAVDLLTREGLEVMGGFIVGFDGDDSGIFDAQRELIGSAPIALAMVGVLQAMPGTALWRRLDKEGRLRKDSAGDQFGRPNFLPAMGERELLEGYRDLLRDLYRPEAYYRRCQAYVERAGRQRTSGGKGLFDMLAVVRAVLHVGIVSDHRRLFWRLIGKVFSQAPHTLRRAIVHVVQGEHLIRYTQQTVLPRLQAAIDEIDRERQERPVGPGLAAIRAQSTDLLSTPALAAGAD